MLKIAASSGATIFVSFAGPTGRLSGTVSLPCASSHFVQWNFLFQIHLGDCVHKESKCKFLYLK
jgi:hypothetical protein